VATHSGAAPDDIGRVGRHSNPPGGRRHRGRTKVLVDLPHGGYRTGPGQGACTTLEGASVVFHAVLTRTTGGAQRDPARRWRRWNAAPGKGGLRLRVKTSQPGRVPAGRTGRWNSGRAGRWRGHYVAAKARNAAPEDWVRHKRARRALPVVAGPGAWPEPEALGNRRWIQTANRPRLNIRRSENCVNWSSADRAAGPGLSWIRVGPVGHLWTLARGD